MNLNRLIFIYYILLDLGPPQVSSKFGSNQNNLRGSIDNRSINGDRRNDRSGGRDDRSYGSDRGYQGDRSIFNNGSGYGGFDRIPQTYRGDDRAQRDSGRYEPRGRSPPQGSSQGAVYYDDRRGGNAGGGGGAYDDR